MRHFCLPEFDFWQTRIGLEMIQKGLGYVPVHNPAQIDDIADSVINEGRDFDGGGGGRTCRRPRRSARGQSFRLLINPPSLFFPHLAARDTT